MFNTIIAYAQRRMAARRRYNQAVAEIDAMSQRDLTEIGAFQIDLYRAAREEFLSGEGSTFQG